MICIEMRIHHTTVGFPVSLLWFADGWQRVSFFWPVDLVLIHRFGFRSATVRIYTFPLHLVHGSMFVLETDGNGHGSHHTIHSLGF